MIYIEYRNRHSVIPQIQMVAFIHQAKTKLLLEGYLPTDNLLIWQKLYSDEIAELTPYDSGENE